MSWVNNPDNNIVIISSSDPDESFSDRDTDESLEWESQYTAGLGNCTGTSSDSESPSQACKITKNANTVTARTARERRSVKRRGIKSCHQILGETRTCHWCRRRSERNHVQCSQCTSKFCGKCLKTQHGENVDEESEPGVKWVCPKCRRGCGPGCKNNCCNCGKCRQPQGPNVLKEMLDAGFSDVHDYLIHQETGESKAVIANRKKFRKWTKAGAVTLILFANIKKEKCTSPSSEAKPDTEGENESSTCPSSHPSFEKTQKDKNSLCLNPNSCFHQNSSKEDRAKRPDESDHLCANASKTICNGNEGTKIKGCHRGDQPHAKRNEKIQHDNKHRQVKMAGLDDSADEESDVLIGGVAKRDPFEAFGNMERNIYLMRLFCNRERVFDGNQLSITLSDKELQQAKAIKGRSLAKVIAHRFDPKRLLNRPQYEQDCMRKSLKVALANRVNECKMRLAEEIDLVITEDFQQLKQNLKKSWDA